MTADPEVLCDKRGQTLWVTINRPDKRNALNDSVLAGISAAYVSAESDSDVRLVVLTGSGEKAFCAGADLDPGKSFAFDASRPTTRYADLLRQVHRCRLPTIARVNGACMAGGMGLLCMADVAVAVEHAVFGLPEVKLGLFPMQVLALLKCLVPPRLLSEWCLTGERLDAVTALRAGLVNRVAPQAQLDELVAALSDRVCGNSPMAIRRGKYALQSMQYMSFEEALAFGESQIALMAGTDDAREGLAAFAEHRPPQWK